MRGQVKLRRVQLVGSCGWVDGAIPLLFAAVFLRSEASPVLFFSKLRIGGCSNYLTRPAGESQQTETPSYFCFMPNLIWVDTFPKQKLKLK